MILPRSSLLADVNDVFNGIMVRGDATGDVVFYGKGAGKLPTASAVVADIIDCVKHFKARKYLFWEDAKPDYVERFEDMPGDVFIHVRDRDSDTAFDKAEQVFCSPVRLIRKDEEEGEAGFTVKDITERELLEKLARLEAEGVQVLGRIRISDF